MIEAPDPSDQSPQQVRQAPTRPALTSTVPSPLEHLRRPRPRVLTLSVGLWIISCLAGLLVGAYFATRIDEVRAELTATLRLEDPDISASSLNSVVDTTLLVALGGLAAAAGLKLLLAMLMGGRRNGARFLLAIVGVLGLPVSAVAVSTLSGDALVIPGYVLAGIGAQEVFMLAGLVTMFLPSSNSWFRDRLR